MLYLSLYSFLMIMGLAAVVRSFHIPPHTDRDVGVNFAPLVAFAKLILALLVGSPFILAFITAAVPVDLLQLSQLSEVTQWSGALSAFLLCLLYAWQAYHASPRFLATGATVAAAMLTFIFVDSLLFVSSKDMGVLSTVVVNEGNVNDVYCERALILIHRGHDAPTVWRCPTGVILLADTSSPFLPWPDYRQGQSTSLSGAIDTLLHYAKKP